MNRSTLLIVAGLLGLLAARPAQADDVKYTEENGITYRETTQVVQRPIPHTQFEPREYTYYRERVTQDVQDVPRTYQVPVTQYQWEAYWQNRWNPFVQPTMAYRMVPRTHYETRTEVVKVPVARREMVPEKITQQVPVTTHKIAEERVVTRVAVGTTGSAGAPPSTLAWDPYGRPTSVPMTAAAPQSGAAYNTAAAPSSQPGTLPSSGDPIGGVSKLDPNQPKQNPDWRASDSLLRR